VLHTNEERVLGGVVGVIFAGDLQHRWYWLQAQQQQQQQQTLSQLQHFRLTGLHLLHEGGLSQAAVIPGAGVVVILLLDCCCQPRVRYWYCAV